ncbi:MAG: NADH-quinone oxidoreductase subunit NuoE [Ammonifex sp.]|jgi:NADH-quinone oxidoreductase subunit E|nr:MAG: NADH-quinone oxidoreductase subunit NuoE [Ammonifex sp.]
MHRECLRQLDDILSRHDKNRSALIPVIQEAQELFGYLPREALLKVAAHLGVPASAVYGVATFYAQFYLTPRGRHRVKVCQGTACHVRGGRSVLEAVKKQLGVGPGETTPDQKFTLERVACVGSCSLAPVVLVDEKILGGMTPDKVSRLTKASTVKERMRGRAFKIKMVFKIPAAHTALFKETPAHAGKPMPQPAFYSAIGQKQL